jgi:hypothetical protein
LPSNSPHDQMILRVELVSVVHVRSHLAETVRGRQAITAHLNVADAREFLVDCTVFAHDPSCRVQRPLHCAPQLASAWVQGAGAGDANGAEGVVGGDVEHVWR